MLKLRDSMLFLQIREVQFIVSGVVLVEILVSCPKISKYGKIKYRFCILLLLLISDLRSPSPVDPAHARCPVCTLHLNWEDVEAHLTAELDRLSEICR